MLHCRPTETIPYEVLTTQVEDGVLHWTVSDIDTAIAGEGIAEIQLVREGLKAIAVRIKTKIGDAFSDEFVDDPTIIETYIDQLIREQERLLIKSIREINDAGKVYSELLNTGARAVVVSVDVPVTQGATTASGSDERLDGMFVVAECAPDDVDAQAGVWHVETKDDGTVTITADEPFGATTVVHLVMVRNVGTTTDVNLRGVVTTVNHYYPDDDGNVQIDFAENSRVKAVEDRVTEAEKDIDDIQGTLQTDLPAARETADEAIRRTEYLLSNTGANLFDNSNFGNPVNNMGEFVHTINGITYLMDRWRLPDDGYTVLSGSSLMISGGGSLRTVDLTQTFEYGALSTGKDYTAVIYLADETTDVQVVRPVAHASASGENYKTVTITVPLDEPIAAVALYEGIYEGHTIPYRAKHIAEE